MNSGVANTYTANPRRIALRALLAEPIAIGVCLLGTALCVASFIGLETTPPGFNADESRGALHQICLVQQGTDAYANRWPWVAPAGGDGLYSAPFLYLGMLWFKLFSLSIGHARALTALFTVLTTLGATAVAARVAGAATARFTFLAAALSPWGFQFARIAWDPPLAPAFLIWAIYFWLGRRRTSSLVLSSFCFVLALYTYPPTRIHAPLVFGALMLWALLHRTLRVREVAIFAAVGVPLVAPLLKGTLDGSLGARASSEVITAREFVLGNRGHFSSARFVLQTLADNLFAHFRPSFLFFFGDENLRHSTGFFGVFGLLDDLALVIALVVLGAQIKRMLLGGSAAPMPSGASRISRLAVARGQLGLLGAAGYVFGLLPAALCWDGVPHALRAIGSWPFLALMTGCVLSAAAERWGHRASVPTLALGVVHSVLFLFVYFVLYPPLAPSWFDDPPYQAMLGRGASRHEKAELARSAPDAIRFYLIAYRGQTCASSIRALNKHRF